MLSYEDALNMAYYKMTSFTGWMGGMRFKIGKQELPLPEDAEEGTKPDLVFGVWVWPGPYNFDITPEDRKEYTRFPFDEDGRRAAVDWVNEQSFHTEKWPRKKVDTAAM